MLVPLAQGRSPVGDWLAAVEAAGPSTPLSDPMLVGTVFIPHNEVRAVASRNTHTALMWWQTSDAPDSSSASAAALQLCVACEPLNACSSKVCVTVRSLYISNWRDPAGV